MDRTKIEWADASWNPIRARNRDTGKVGWFCTHASPGCGDHTGGGCYAEAINRRLGTGVDYRAQDLAKVEIFLDEKMLKQPLRWRRPRRIFVGSMTDLFGEFVPDAMIDCIYAVMAMCPQHTFLLLTKRAGRMRDYITALGASDWYGRLGDARKYSLAAIMGRYPDWPLPNVWLGVSVEDQRRADERIPELLATPAAVRWISAEPLLGPIELDQLRDVLDGLTGNFAYGPDWNHLDWVVCGGEGGPHARPFNVEWARSIIGQCKASATACFVKQLGASPYGSGFIDLSDRKGGDISEWPEDLRVREYPERGDG